MLGDDLLVAPVDPFIGVTPVHQPMGPYNSLRSVWLPPGTWINAFTGTQHTGDGTTWVHLDVPLEQTALYHKANGMVVTFRDVPEVAENVDWSDLVLNVFTARTHTDNSGTRYTRRVLVPSTSGRDDDKHAMHVTADETHTDNTMTLTVHIDGSDNTALASTWTVCRRAFSPYTNPYINHSHIIPVLFSLFCQ